MMRSQKSEVRGPRPAARWLALLAAALALSGSSTSVRAETTNAPAKLSYDSFRTVSDRNIFNPNRYARGAGRTTTRTPATPASRVESFSLVGIMAYEKGVFAFFDGTKGDYKQAVQTGGAIGEYKVVHVSATQVKLALATNTFDLKVGMQMRREDEGDWFLSEGGETPRKRIVSTRTRTRGGAHSGSVTNSAGEEMPASSEPEVIVVENETPAAEPAVGNANGNGAVAPAEADAGDEGVTDPVLRALMERRRNALNR